MTIVGARPQFIKAAAVSSAIRRISGWCEKVLHTGQHYDDAMSSVFFDELDMAEPDFNLGIGSGSHGAQTGRMLVAIEEVLVAERPHCVLVYGDTNSTLAGALAAVKLHIPLAHVESGLRSRNRRMPEEINRVLTDHMSDLLFTPSAQGFENLRAEGIAEERIRRTGDVMYDAALIFGKKAEQAKDRLSWLGVTSKGYILATVHRAENTDDRERLGAILRGLMAVSREIPVVFPVHPRTRERASRWGLEASLAGSERFKVCPPLGYLDMACLERNARLIATDSGGVQKEAYFYKVPCATLREETEWLELVSTGWNRLVPLDSDESVRAGILMALDTRGEEIELYGDGQAGATIVGELGRTFGAGFRR